MALPENMTGMVVEAHGDGLTLLVRRGGSAWCGQAEGGLVKVGRGAWSKGEYEVLVGTNAPGGEKPFRLRIVEVAR